VQHRDVNNNNILSSLCPSPSPVDTKAHFYHFKRNAQEERERKKKNILYTVYFAVYSHSAFLLRSLWCWARKQKLSVTKAIRCFSVVVINPNQKKSDVERKKKLLGREQEEVSNVASHFVDHLFSFSQVPDKPRYPHTSSVL
jgi:hypothetical protein